MEIEVTSRLQRLEVGSMLDDGRCKFLVVSSWTVIQAPVELTRVFSALLAPVDTQGLEIDWEVVVKPASGDGWEYQAWLKREVWQPLAPFLGEIIKNFLTPFSLGREREELDTLGQLPLIEEELRKGMMVAKNGSRWLFLNFDDRRGHPNYSGRIWTNDGRGDLVKIAAGSTVRCLNEIEGCLARTMSAVKA